MKSVPVTARKRVAARAECRRCHYRFPKQEMHEVKLISSRQHYAAGGRYKGESVGSRSGWVCDECYPAYKRENRFSLSDLMRAILRGILGFVGTPAGRQ